VVPLDTALPEPTGLAQRRTAEGAVASESFGVTVEMAGWQIGRVTTTPDDESSRSSDAVSESRFDNAAPTARLRWYARLFAVGVLVFAPLWLPAAGAAAHPAASAHPPLAGAAGAEPVAPGAGGDLPEGWVNTQWGPLGPGDRALIEGVRRADLWEGPAGQMAMDKGKNARVKEIGFSISRQHVEELDPVVRKIATQLGVALPNEPNADQKTWLSELQQASGDEFDRIFVDRLRAAHGKVFALIATVRANTRNDVVRDFAVTANKYVDNHMKFLESTGLVQFNALPTPAAPTTPAAKAVPRGFATGTGGNTTVSQTVVLVVVAVALVAGVATTMRIVRPR
jgi:predicted outer membrane protein